METNQVPHPPQGFMETLEYYLVTKAPFQIPANVKEMIVQFGPWLACIVLLATIPLFLTFLGLGSMFLFYSPYYMVGGGNWYMHFIFTAITFVLEIVALPGLFGRKMFGWNMIFYATVVSFLGSVLSGNVIGGIIFAIISLYVLFQIRSYYS